MCLCVCLCFVNVNPRRMWSKRTFLMTTAEAIQRVQQWNSAVHVRTLAVLAVEMFKKINRMWLMACVTCSYSILTVATNLIRFILIRMKCIKTNTNRLIFIYCMPWRMSHLLQTLRERVATSESLKIKYLRPFEMEWTISGHSSFSTAKLVDEAGFCMCREKKASERVKERDYVCVFISFNLKWTNLRRIINKSVAQSVK